MTKTASRVVAVFALVALAACGNSSVDIGSDSAALVDRVESEVSKVADQVDAAEVEAEVATAWDQLQVELTSVVESVRSGADVDTEAVEAQMEQFSAQVENSGVTDDLRQAWTELKSRFDSMLASLS